MAFVFNDWTIEGSTGSPLWHPRLSLLALWSSTGVGPGGPSTSSNGSGGGGTEVKIYTQDARLLHSVPTNSSMKAMAPVKVAWHPQKAILAIALHGGSVGVWSETLGGNLQWNESAHKSTIASLCWNSSGTRLLTADENGAVNIWKWEPAIGRILLTGVTHSIPSNRGTPSHSVCISTGGSEDRFLLATDQGCLYVLAADGGSCTEGFPGTSGATPTATSKLAFVFLHDHTSVITMTQDLVVTQFSIIDTNVVVDRQAKLSFPAQTAVKGAHDGTKSMQAISLGDGILAITVGGSSIRIIDLVQGDNEELSMEDTEAIRFHCIAYHAGQKLLAGGTDSGHVLLWQRVTVKDARGDSERTWKPMPKINMGGAVEGLGWDSTGNAFFARKKTSVKLVGKQATLYHMKNGEAALQISTSQVSVCRLGGKAQLYSQVNTGIRVQGVFVQDGRLLVWSGTESEIYEFSESLASNKLVGRFANTATVQVLEKQSVYLALDRRVDVCNFDGVVKQTFSFGFDANITGMDLSGAYLTVVSGKGQVAVLDVSRREAKVHQTAVDIANITNVEALSVAKSNPTGEFTCFLASSKLYAWDWSKNAATEFDMYSHTQLPTDLNWDEKDARLLLVEIKRTASQEEPSEAHQHAHYATFFVTTEHGIRPHQQAATAEHTYKIVSSAVPHVFGIVEKPAPGSWLHSELQRDFVGIDAIDKTTVTSLLDFGFHLSNENLENAFKSVVNIRATNIWENLAKMCVKSRRLDVAFTCLGNMANARALQALRRLSSQDSYRKLAILAVHLNMPEEAEQIYREHKCYRELSELYQAQGKWELARDVLEKADRISAKTVTYAHAKHLEEAKRFQEAAELYEKAGTGASDVPRMLLNKAPAELEAYVKASSDLAVKKWWAQYAESQGAMEVAFEGYQEANDVLSLVRLHCTLGNIEQAEKLAGDGKQLAACFHLARHFEQNGKIPESLEWYGKAKCFHHAVRLAKENQMDTELMQLAVQGSNDLMLDVARYFEQEQEAFDKAASLYYKGGNSGKAIDLCLRTKQFHMLDIITADLRPDTNPEILARCGVFYLERGDFAKAIGLLMKGKQVERALNLCLEKNITVTEEMAEQMVSDTDSGLLVKLADVCHQQGSYHLACKKYTQAGERMKAMTSLLKSGDSQKIIFFANVSGAKQKEIYVMAANYLQTLPWHESPDLIKSIVLFYTKAKSWDTLVRFYESWAQMEIDDYSDYEKALIAIKEAAKAASKDEAAQRDMKPQLLEYKAELMEKFVAARRCATSDIGRMYGLCQELLKLRGIDEAVRVGDIYGCMVESYYAGKDVERARVLLVEMEKALPPGATSYYLEEKLIRAIKGDAGNDGNGKAKPQYSSRNLFGDETEIEEELVQ